MRNLTYLCTADCYYGGRYLYAGESLTVVESVIPSKTWVLTHINGKRAKPRQVRAAERRFEEYQAVMADKLAERFDR